MKALGANSKRPRVTALAIGGLVFASASAAWFGIRVNWTSSMPIGLYLETAVDLEREAMVFVCLPEAIARVGSARKYLPAGGCPSGTSSVLKQVLALPGDRVDLREDFLAVNELEVQRSRIRAVDSLGRPLDHASYGRRTVQDGELWVVGLNRERSWDSRYFGPIPLTSVVGAARPLLTLPLARSK